MVLSSTSGNVIAIFRTSSKSNLLRGIGYDSPLYVERGVDAVARLTSDLSGGTSSDKSAVFDVLTKDDVHAIDIG